MFLIFTSRKTNKPLHIISFGSSGVGKSHLQERVGELIPKEDKIELTSVSGNAFYYYVDDDLGHKLILIEDYDGVRRRGYNTFATPIFAAVGFLTHGECKGKVMEQQNKKQ
jgi:hypothetical protein